MVAAVSTRTALLALYGGVTLSELDRGHGTAVLQFGVVAVRVPLRLLATPMPQPGTLLSKDDAVQLGKQLCARASWTVCYDFLRARRSQPVFRQLFAEASVSASAATPWVVSHALQIRSAAAQTAVLTAFQTLSRAVPSFDTLEKKLEATLATPLVLTVDEAAQFFRFTSAFELRPALRSRHDGAPQLSIGGIVPVFFALRDWCFVTLYCLAAPTAIWDTPPGLYKAAVPAAS